eukprot:10900608-Prorocentrum_lima.AAC.1
MVEEVLRGIPFTHEVGDVGKPSQMRISMNHVANNCKQQKRRLAACLTRIGGSRDSTGVCTV